jgi:hypothetical protein
LLGFPTFAANATRCATWKAESVIGVSYSFLLAPNTFCEKTIARKPSTGCRKRLVFVIFLFPLQNISAVFADATHR